jgi:hypothetical protein
MPIILGGKRITSFSNPISVAVLKPTQKFIGQQAQYGLNAPVFLLFGDYHVNLQNTCKNCTCNLSTRSCCMDVNDQSWMDLLAKVSTADKPVDIFLEYSTAVVTDSGQRKQFLADASKSEQMLNDAKNTFKKCFAQQKKCGARYHLTDPRTTINHSAKNHMPRYYYDALHLEFELGLISNNKAQIATMKKWAKANSEFKQCMESVLDGLLELTADTNTATFTKRWIDMYFDNPWFEKNSLVAKQIRKCKGPLADKNTWKQLGLDLANAEARVTQNQLKKLHSRIKEYVRIFKHNGSENTLAADKHLGETAAFACPQIFDMYNLGRAWKKPDEAMNPALVTIYQGAFHTESQIKALTRQKMYEIAFYEPQNLKFNAKFDKDAESGKISRCIKVEGAINIDSIIGWKPVRKPTSKRTSKRSAKRKRKLPSKRSAKPKSKRSA